MKPSSDRRSARRSGATLFDQLPVLGRRFRGPATDQHEEERSKIYTAREAVNLYFPKKFEPWFHPHRYKVARGGRGSAKSHSAAGALVQRCAQRTTRWLCAREIQTSIKESVHRLLRDKIYSMKMEHLFEITDTEIRGRYNGSFINFAGLRNNVSKIKSMEGLDGAWVEEAEKVSDDSWAVLIPTVRAPGSEIWITYNPELETDPTHVRFAKNPPPDTLMLVMNWQDNPWFPEVLRAEKDYLYKVDPEAAEWVWGGKCRAMSGAAVLRGKWVVEHFPDHLWRSAPEGTRYGADFGFAADPSTLVRCFMLNNKLYLDSEAWGLHIELDHLPRFYSRVPRSKTSLILADSSRPETISHLRGKGYNMRAAKKWDGSVEDGIAHLRGFEQIVIHPRCKHAIEEATLYAYKVDRLTKQILPEVVDRHNHIWDAVRYSLDGYITRSGDRGIYEGIAARVAEASGGSQVVENGVTFDVRSDEILI